MRKGDTLGGIADQFSVTSEQVRKWNGLKSGKVSRGMVLRIYTVGGAAGDAHGAPNRETQYEKETRRDDHGTNEKLACWRARRMGQCWEFCRVTGGM